jgi:hypothetical protein
MDNYMYDGADNAIVDWNDDDIHDWFVPIDVPNPASDRTLEQLQALSAQVLLPSDMFTVPQLWSPGRYGLWTWLRAHCDSA